MKVFEIVQILKDVKEIPKDLSLFKFIIADSQEEALEKISELTNISK